MIYNSEFLFIHVPKTGGMALSQVLTENLSGDVCMTIPDGHFSSTSRMSVLPGIRHENLVQASAHLSSIGRSLKDFKLIVSVVRDPYEMEYSRFKYLRGRSCIDRGDARDFALNGDFNLFAVKSKWWFRDVSTFYQINGVIPDNLDIVRYEHINDDFLSACSPFFSGITAIPVVNKSMVLEPLVAMSADAEESIYHKYRWVFDRGLYPRRFRE